MVPAPDASRPAPTGGEPRASDGHRAARRWAAAMCFLQAAVLAGFGVFYLVELALGYGSDAARVLTSGILILVFAAALAWLGRLWLGSSRWPVTPTVLWNVLLVPVTVSLAQAGQVVQAVAVGVVVVASVLVAVAAGGAPVDPTGGAARR